jgi:probable HAF family extracellular repeat protein
MNVAMRCVQFVSTAFFAAHTGAALAEPPRYHFVDLGVDTRAVSINASGQVLGNFGGDPIGYAGITTGGAWTSIDSYYNRTFPRAINDSGAAVGTRGTYAVIWRPTGQAIKLTPEAKGTAYAIGQDGTAYGVAEPYRGVPFTYAWKKGVLTPIGGLAGAYETYPKAVNRIGQIVGCAQPHRQYGPCNVVARLDGTWQKLGGFGGTLSSATGINDAGVIVGYASLPGNTVIRGFVYRDGAMQDIGSFGGNTTQANAINNAGVFVGGSSDAAGVYHAFVYVDETMFNLEDLLDNGVGGLTNLGAYAINDVGQIAGLARDAAGHAHGWLATPIETAAVNTGPRR